ncbi:MAG: glycosyltransferase [Atopobiaceae bacterium]|nr:glycosyltransferase [Atopobiaceae bacterium]
MRDHTLASLVFDDEGFFAEHPQIAVRTVCGSATYDANDGELVARGDVDFTTYLNALSIGKWRQYANVGGVCLRLELRGDAATVYGTCLRPGSAEVERGSAPLARIEPSDDWQMTDVSVPVPEGTHIVSFALVSEGEVRLRGGSWYTQVNEAAINEVRLGIATTTFRKETYVTRNIEAIRTELFGGSDGACDKFHLFVVDNGRTLDAEALSDNNVTVIPNPNVGGSGGFARGMMAALDADCTHVLLMDDDVRVFPESFKRTYNLLSLVNERYAQAFVEGGMLNMEDPNILFEDVATVKRDGMYYSVNRSVPIDTVEGMGAVEATDVELPRTYGAWWYCCIPTSVVRSKGLPLPLFVRCDDVEYGLRCEATFMTMNGICVWHERFEGRFKGSVDSYQLTRNFLIMAACDNLDKSIVRAFMMRFRRTFHIFLRSMNYDTCDLMLDGLADYLKGPSFIAEADGEKLLMKNGKKNEPLVDVEELDSQIIGAAKPDHRYLAAERDRGMLLKTLEMIPHDRHVLPDVLLSKDPAPMYFSRGAYPARKTMRHSVLVAYDRTGKKAHIRTMDRARWARLRERMHVLMAEYRKRNNEVVAEYRDAMPYLTSREFWEDYLERRSDA